MSAADRTAKSAPGKSADRERPARPFGAEIGVMVVGTPRSGTTLVQRTVSERCGLPTVPETHMFTVFAPRLLRTTRFPLEGPELRAALDAYAALQQHRGGAPSAELLFDRLSGRADSLAEVFVAVVGELAGGADRVVEKTPDHLLWVRHLAPVFPDTRFIAVIRDPRAVFASTAKTHWGQRNAVVAAERWARDQRLLLSLDAEFGGRRTGSDPDDAGLLLIRYEDLVLDEEQTVRRIVEFVGTADASDRSPARHGIAGPSRVFREHEMEWKARAQDPVTTERIEAWRQTLPAGSVSAIEAICGPLMDEFGYQRTLASADRLSMGDRISRGRYRLRRIGHEQRILRSYAPRAGLR